MSPDTPRYRARRLPIGVLTSVAVVAMVAALAGILMIVGGSTPPPVADDVPTAAVAADRSSAPVRIMIDPTADVRAIDEPVWAMPSRCADVIEPPYDPARVGGVFWCSDFAQLGDHGEKVAVLAGHAGTAIDTAFNDLYPRGGGFVGQTVRFETAASELLRYRVEAVHLPDKQQLPYLTEVWGAPGENVRGRVVLVTCLQTADGTWGKNYVAVLTPA